MSTGVSGVDTRGMTPGAGEAVPAESDLGLLRETVRKVAAGGIAPEVAGIERGGAMPKAVFKALAETDFHAVGVPARHGGAGASALEAVVVIEEVARVSAAASVIPAQGFVASCALGRAEPGSEQGSILSAIAGGGLPATVPLAGAGAGGASARAGQRGWTLQGALEWVPWPFADAEAALVAEVETEEGPRLLAYRLSGDEAGDAAAASMLGFRGMPLRSLGLSGLEVPAGSIASEGGRSQVLAWRAARLIAVAAQASGTAVMALEAAEAYVRERRQFGRAIGEFQALRVMLADMATRTESARRLTYAAAEAIGVSAGPEVVRLAASAKLHASDVAMSVATDAVQLFGGYGFMKDYPVERAMRDAKMTQLLAGDRLEQQCVIADVLARSGAAASLDGTAPGPGW
ncbi:MAG: acyl-CoA dehydrogenase family protein [Actinomycetota bacterium]|nr:acyl-CoA dehydrogenase family protein [Actinomycetota bacterium]